MIREMRAKGMRIKDIAAELDVHPRTVSRALKRGGPPPGRRPRRTSKLDPFKSEVDRLLGEGIWNATVILDRLRELGFEGQISIVRDYIRPKRALAPSRATVRFETPPGLQLQHDWGYVEAEVAGERRRIAFAVNVLGYSRAFHVFAAPRADAEHTYESLVRAFEHFGGVPGEVLVDNQKSAVAGRRGGTVRFNDRFVDLAGHYGLEPRACRIRRARTKGKVERLVRYIKENFFVRHCRFESFAHLNRLLAAWLANTADQREHRDLGERITERFARERPALQALPRARFDTAYREHRQVSWDGYISVAGNRYSVPDRYCGQTVAIRLTLDGGLQVYDLAGTEIAAHRLTDPAAGWRQDPIHHRRLWAEALCVEARDLAVYEEVAS